MCNRKRYIRSETYRVTTAGIPCGMTCDPNYRARIELLVNPTGHGPSYRGFFWTTVRLTQVRYEYCIIDLSDPLHGCPSWALQHVLHMTIGLNVAGRPPHPPCCHLKRPCKIFPRPHNDRLWRYALARCVRRQASCAGRRETTHETRQRLSLLSCDSNSNAHPKAPPCMPRCIVLCMNRMKSCA